MPINVRLLRLEVARQAAPQIQRKVRSLVKLDFDNKVDQFFEDFDNDSVTQEIKDGPRALSTHVSSSEGNLFSLLGFYKEQKPIQALRRYLKQAIKLGTTRPARVQGDKLIIETPVQMPSIDEIDEAMQGNEDSRLEWDDRSFTQLLRRGIAGLPHYLFSLVRGFENSRSGTAIQTKNTVRQGSVGPIPYVDKLLATLRARIGGGR